MRLLFTFLLTTLSSVAFAQNSIAIHQKDGNVATFAFSEKPVVTYSGNDLVLTTKQTTVTYPVYMLQKIVFDLKDIADDIDALEVEGKSEFSFQGETLNISGGEPGSSVFIYNMSNAIDARLETSTYNNKAVLYTSTAISGTNYKYINAVLVVAS